MSTRRARPHAMSPSEQADLIADWRTESECRQGHDPELWYPPTASEAWLGVAICHTCPVREACLEHSLAHHESSGTWGGLTEWQREAHRRRVRKGGSRAVE